jgi:hypothetical protein
MLKDRKNYETKLEAQLAQWKADIDVMKAKAAQKKVGAMVKYDEGIDTLMKKHKDADRHLHNLKAATDEAWEGAKASTEKVWDEVKALLAGPSKTH